MFPLQQKIYQLLFMNLQLIWLIHNLILLIPFLFFLFFQNNPFSNTNLNSFFLSIFLDLHWNSI